MMVFRAMRLIITFLSLLLIAATPLPSAAPPSEITGAPQTGATHTEEPQQAKRDPSRVLEQKEVRPESTSQEVQSTTQNYYCEPGAVSGGSGWNTLFVCLAAIFTGALVVTSYKQKFCFLRLDIGEFVATGPYNECT